MIKKDIREFTKNELKLFIVDQKYPQYRVNQIYEWIWQHHQLDFKKMLNVPLELREILDQNFVFKPIQEIKQTVSVDGTTKFLFKIDPDKVVEGVLIPQLNRLTACISSQVGCSLACEFCATGKLKLDRNLSAGEIYDQVFLINQYCLKVFNKSVTNIVFMGMGEPFLNIKHVLRSIDYITGEIGMAISAKRITVSTSGITKIIRKIADMKTKFNLAISLHSAINEKRNQIMEINKTNNLDSLLESLQYFYMKTSIKPTYEYILLKGFNDSIEDAKELVKFCNKIPSKVNLIEYNKVDGIQYQKSTEQSTKSFMNLLESNNIIVKLRRSRGHDINAACGQLATQHNG